MVLNSFGFIVSFDVFENFNSSTINVPCFVFVFVFFNFGCYWIEYVLCVILFHLIFVAVSVSLTDHRISIVYMCVAMLNGMRFIEKYVFNVPISQTIKQSSKEYWITLWQRDRIYKIFSAVASVYCCWAAFFLSSSHASYSFFSLFIFILHLVWLFVFG